MSPTEFSPESPVSHPSFIESPGITAQQSRLGSSARGASNVEPMEYRCLVGWPVRLHTYLHVTSGLVAQGMTPGQSLLTIILGNLVVLVPVLLNAHAGTRYSIPFPVLLRASFGTLGASIPP